MLSFHCILSVYEISVDANISRYCVHTAGATGSIPVPPTNQNKDLSKLPEDLLLEFGTIESLALALRLCRLPQPPIRLSSRRDSPT
jgi:hypothetical protein